MISWFKNSPNNLPYDRSPLSAKLAPIQINYILGCEDALPQGLVLGLGVSTDYPNDSGTFLVVDRWTSIRY